MLDEIHGIEPGFHGVDEECDSAQTSEMHQRGSCPTPAKCDDYGCVGACVRNSIQVSFAIRLKNRLYRIRLRFTNWIAEHSFGKIKHHWFY